MDLIRSFRQAQSHTDLFEFWQQETELRLQLRQQKVTDISPAQNGDELDFLLRSLYFGGRPDDFFTQLKAALNSASSLQWWKSSPPWLKAEFFSFLSLQLADETGKSLQFLIHLYEPDLDHYYTQLLSQLTLNQCRYLMSKTANASLRSLLKTRERDILSLQENRHYGLLRQQDFNGDDSAALADKRDLVKAALFQLDQANRQHYTAPYGIDRGRALLDAVDKIYQSGLIQDALLLMEQIYRAFQSQHRLQEILHDQRLGPKLTRLVSKTVGTQVLLSGELRLSDQATQFHKQSFPSLEVDQGLLAILRLYEALLSSPVQMDSLPWEILARYEDIQQLFPEYSFPEMGSHQAAPDAGQQLLNVADSLLSSTPHAAFIIMELSRIMAKHSLIHLDKQDRQQLLTCYLSLWKWVPSHLFMNANIMDDLANWSNNTLRQEAERIMSFLSEPGKPASLLTDLQKRPELYRGGAEPIRSQALYGYLLGVLE
jgi:hypothetical protein